MSDLPQQKLDRIDSISTALETIMKVQGEPYGQLCSVALNLFALADAASSVVGEEEAGTVFSATVAMIEDIAEGTLKAPKDAFWKDVKSLMAQVKDLNSGEHG
jgi:hypothetical protein